MKKLVIGFMAFSFILFHANGVQALILPRLTMEEMVLRADAIVTGRSERFHIHPDREGNVLYAIVTFKVEEYLKNDLEKDEIVIMQIAQERGPDGKFSAGPLALKIDEEVILFLTEEDNQGFRHVLGLSKGKYTVIQNRPGEKRLVQDLKGVRLFDKETGEIRDAKNIQVKLTYEEFKALVRRIASRIEAKRETFAVLRPNNSF